MEAADIIRDFRFPQVSNVGFIALYIAANGPTRHRDLHRALLAWRGHPFDRGRLVRYFNFPACHHGGGGHTAESVTGKGYWWRPYRGAPYELTMLGLELVAKAKAKLEDSQAGTFFHD